MSAAAYIPATLRDSTLAKTLATYVSGSWVMLQVVTTFIDGLGLPDWVFTGFLLIVLSGVPVLLFVLYQRTRPAREARAVERSLRLGRLSLGRAAIGGGLMISAWVVVVAAFMASWAFGIGPAASLMAAGNLKASDSILITDFDNRTSDPLLGGTVAEAIRVDLNQSNLVRIVDRTEVGEALKRMKRPEESIVDAPTARQIAMREGIAATLEGRVSSLGPATIILARLVDARSGHVLAEYEERAREPSELLDAVDKLSSTLRNKIGEPLTKLRVEPPLAKVTTSSLEALRSYTRANVAHGRGNKKAAVALLKSAVAEDPQFPMAWRKLGVLLSDDDRGGARLAYTRAYELRGNLPVRERELAIGSYMKNVANDLPQAMAAYRRVLADYPDEEVALNNLANLYTAYQQPEQALALQQKVVAIRPRFAAYANLFNSYLRLGRLDDARRTHVIAAGLYPDQKKIRLQPIELAVAAGDFPLADRLIEEFRRANTKHPELANDLFVARYYLRRGRLAEAKAVFRARVEINAADGEAVDAIANMTSLVAIARAEGQPATGRALMAEALSRFPLDKIPEADRPMLDLAEAYALSGDVANARRSLDLARRFRVDDSSLNYDQTARVEGLIALASGDSRGAAAILEKASHFGQCSSCLLFDLALAQEEAGDAAAARATLERYRDLAPHALGRAEYLGFALARLAALQAQAGAAAGAAETRAQLATLWSSADPGLLAAVTATGPVQAG